MNPKPFDGITATPMELRHAGIDALVKALGPIGTVRFLQELALTRGDYTAERDSVLGNPTVDALVDELLQRKQGPSG